jgi:hypothetical protein
MNAIGPQVHHLINYRVWADTDGFHARYDGTLSAAARNNGCVEELTDAEWVELVRRACGNRLRAERLATKPADFHDQPGGTAS